MTLDRHRSAGYMTNWGARLFATAIERRLKPRGIAAAYLPVFFALDAGRALTQKELAIAAAVEQPTMAATLARMERDGLIRRSPDPADGRSSSIALTETALQEVDAVRRATEEVNEVALAELDESERAAFLDMLGRVISALVTDTPAKPPRSARHERGSSPAPAGPSRKKTRA